MNRRWREFSLCGLVFLTGTLPFINAMFFGIVDLDDYQYLVTYKPIVSGLGIDGLKFAFTSLDESIWMPLTWISYMADHTFFGRGNWGLFHLHSILVHGLNAILVYLLLRKVVGFNGESKSVDLICAFAASIWACHPLRCESVVFLASRKDVLSLFFELLALHLWVSRRSSGNAKCGLYALSILCFIFASMAKPSVMTFPLLCFIVDFFIVRRSRPLEYAVPLAIAAALGWFAGYAQSFGGATENVFGMPFWYRIVNAATSFGLYLWNAVWPVDLAPQCVIKWPEWPRFCIPGIAICLVVCGWLAKRLWRLKERFDDEVDVEWHGLSPEWRLRGDAEPVLAGFLWFALAVAPMLGIAGFGYHSMADRFTYIPSIGLSIAVAFAMMRLDFRVPRAWTKLGCAALVLAMCALAWRQTGFWKDDSTLFSHTLEVDGDRNPSAHGILANWNFEFPHDLEKCVEHFERMKSMNLRFMECCFEVYVFALCELGRTKDIPGLLKWYDDWLERDIANNPRWGRESVRYNFLRTIYQCARVAYLITQPDLRPAAAEYLKEIACAKDDDCYLYLLWRLAEAEGDEVKAAEAKRNLVEKAVHRGYVQFRYLRKEAEGDGR